METDYTLNWHTRKTRRMGECELQSKSGYQHSISKCLKGGARTLVARNFIIIIMYRPIPKYKYIDLR